MKKKKTRDSLLPASEISTGVTLFVISVLAVLCFYPSIDGDFVFDDTEAVLNNKDVKSVSPIRQVFANDFWGTRITLNASHKSYRPLTILTFRLNVLAAGGTINAYQFRLVNLMLYVIVCCLAFLVLQSLCRDMSSRHIAVVASVVFTVHPVHTEAVAPAVARADLLSALFMFAAFLVFSQCVGNDSVLKSVVCSLATLSLTVIAMFSKEQGITILAISSARDIVLSLQLQSRLQKSWRTLVVRQLILCSGVVCLLVLRVWLMGGSFPTFQPVDNPASFMVRAYLRVINYIYVYALNVWLLLCPEWLCFDWSMGCVPLITSLQDPRMLIVLVFSFLFGLLLIVSVRSITTQAGLEMMAFAFLVVPFLPASNVFFRVGFVIAERNLLVPSLGFCLLISLGLQRLAKNKISQVVVSLLLGLLVVVFCVRSHLRVRQWRNERDLFHSALSVCPLNAKVHYNLAKTSTDLTVAKLHYRQALRLNPEYDQAMNNLANILKDSGEFSEAESLLRRALQLRPDFAAAWMNLGIVLGNKKQLVEAEQAYWNAIKHRRNYPDCFYNLGNLYLEQKDHRKAYDSWRQAIALNPKHQAAWSNLIIMLDSLGKHDEASSMGSEALAVLPDSSAIHFNLANSLGKTGNYKEAEKHFKTAIKLNSQLPLYYVNLGVLYHHWKKFGSAKEYYHKALELDPSLRSAKENLLLLQKNNL